MKKIILSVVFITGFATYGFATNKIQIKAQEQEPQGNKQEKKKVERYDMSLFKFIYPSLKRTIKDSTKISDERVLEQKSEEEITIYQEKPLSFFTFS